MRDLVANVVVQIGEPMSDGMMYGRTEHEWQQLEDAGWDFLKERAGERRGDPAHDPTVSYSVANEELAARTGQPTFDFGQQAGRAAMGYLLGRISRNRSWPASRLLISALVRHQGEADAGAGFFTLAREVGLIHGSPSNLERLEFWLRHVRQVQAYNWDEALQIPRNPTGPINRATASHPVSRSKRRLRVPRPGQPHLNAESAPAGHIGYAPITTMGDHGT